MGLYEKIDAYYKHQDEPEPLDDGAGKTLIHHNIATFQVMLTRAQAALGRATFTEETKADTDKYTLRSTKVSALFQAQKSIARELRQWIRLLANDAVRKALNLVKPESKSSRKMGLPELMRPLMEAAGDVLDDEVEEQERLEREERRESRKAHYGPRNPDDLGHWRPILAPG